MTAVVVISPLAVGNAQSHTFIDDQFYFSYLVDKACDFSYYTSEESAQIISKEYPSDAWKLRLLPNSHAGISAMLKAVVKVQVPPHSRIVFQGYSEKFVILFWLRNIFKNYSLTLISTNNISRGRVANYRRQLLWFFSILFFQLDKIVVHTDYERDILESVFPFLLRRKVFVKRHHLMIRSEDRKRKLPFRSTRIISFFGPAKEEKPLEPFLELIKADRDRKFNYQIFRVQNSDVNLRYYPLLNQPNVTLSECCASRKAYRLLYSSSYLVFLSHGLSFEGKLSGNVCDSVSLSTPFISQQIEPLNSFEKRYGQIGYFVDFSDPNWPRSFLERCSDYEVSIMRSNLDAMCKDYTRDKVFLDLDDCILN